MFYATYIIQTAQYIQVTARTYIRSFLLKMGWDPEPQGEFTNVPLSPASLQTLGAEQGPLEGTPEALALVEKHSTGYKNLVGYSIFAILIGYIDVSVALYILSKFNLCPASIHYTSAKNVLKYLRDTQAQGPVYWCPKGKEIAGLLWVI